MDSLTAGWIDREQASQMACSLFPVLFDDQNRSFDFYIECCETGSYIAVVAAKPADQSHAVILEGQAITDADVDALDQVLKTFSVVDTLPDAQ